MNNHSLKGLSIEAPTFQPRDLLAILYRRRELFFILSIPFFIGVLIYRLSRPYTPIYVASFDIAIKKEQPIEGIFSQYGPQNVQTTTITQRIVSNLLSVNFTRKVVDSLSLFVVTKEKNHNIEFEARYKTDFEKPLGPYKLEISNNRYRLLKGETIVKDGDIGEEIDLGYLSFRIKPLEKINRESFLTLTFFPRDRIALSLRNSISINVLEAGKIDKGIGSGGLPGSGEGVARRLITGNPDIDISGILRINVYWGNPKDALNIARILSNQIIKEDIEEKSLQYVQSRNFIETQLELYKNRLNELEQEIRVFKEKNRIADLGAKTQSLITQISTLESQRNQIVIEENVIKKLIDFINTKQDTLPNLATNLISSSVQQLYSQLFQAAAELKAISSEYAYEHPKVVEIKSKIDGLKGQLKEEIARRMSSIKTELEGIDAQINQLQTKLENMPEAEINLARLERDRETSEKLYTFFAEKLEEIRVQEAGVTSDLKIINPPISTNRPINTRGRMTSFLFALVISLFVGCAGVVIAEYFDTAIRDVEVIKNKVGLPVYGSIPALGGYQQILRGFERWTRRIGLKRHRRSELKLRTISFDPSDIDFEAFRKLAVNLEFGSPEKEYRAIYLTSPGPEDGKTFVTFNLGLVIGAVGKKVIIVDTDFRKKREHLTDLAHLRKKSGLFEVLQGRLDLKDAIFEFLPPANEVQGLEQSSRKDAQNELVNKVYVLPLGSIPPNPFLFLESTRMEEVLKELKREYDYVIIDGLPALLFADASYIAKISDGVLIVARYGKTTVKELEESRDILNHAKANIIGAVVNNIPYTRDTYYYHYYHKYYSKYYYSKSSATRNS